MKIKKYIYFLLYTLCFCIFIKNSLAKETWILDKELSSINFELPVLLAKDVKGKFNEIEGLIEIDIDNKKNNKAIFSVNIESVEINYSKYRDLLLSDIFFDQKKYPIAFIDTKKFSYQNENEIDLSVDLHIKGVTHEVPTNIKIIKLADDLVQIKSELSFLRSEYKIGTGKWSSSAVLRNNAKITTNLFLFRSFF